MINNLATCIFSSHLPTNFIYIIWIIYTNSVSKPALNMDITIHCSLIFHEWSSPRHSREQLQLWTHTTSKLAHFFLFLSMSTHFYCSWTFSHLFYWHLSLMWQSYVWKLWKAYDENREYNNIHIWDGMG